MLTDNHQSLGHLYHQCVCLITKEVQNTLKRKLYQSDIVQILITSLTVLKLFVFLLCHCVTVISRVFLKHKQCFLYHG